MMNGYSIEDKGDRVLVHGPIPVEDFSDLERMWRRRGLDALVPGVAAALGATFAVCRQGDVEAWRAEADTAAARRADGDEELAWLLGSDTGTSSKTIFSVLAASEALRSRALGRGYASTPSDPADFGRCHRLLERFPAWRERLGEVAETYPKWTPLVREWGHMADLYLEELPSGNCPKLYKLMKELLRD
jgi:hypothetical protein